MTDPAADLARANLYRYLSVAPLPPADPRFQLLADADFRSVVTTALDWIREDPAFHPAQLGPGELHPSDIDVDSLFPDEEGVPGFYLEVFGHSISKDCPPYENEYYSNNDVTFRSQRLADIAGFYHAFKLDRASGVRDRIDHLSFEAEFVQIVIARQLYATEHGWNDALADTCRQAQRRFFAEHLGWWLPAFGVQLEARTHSDFYRTLAGFVRAFAAAERAVLEIAPFTELPSLHFGASEPEGTCFSCGLAGDGSSNPPTSSVFPATDS
jgi:TorA maturation chaperone TorD